MFVDSVVQQYTLVSIAENQAEMHNSAMHSSSANSDFDDTFITIAEVLWQMLNQLNARCVFARRIHVPRSMKMVDWVDYWAMRNPRRFRGLVKMVPSAFEDLALQLATTMPFAKCTHSKVWEKVMVAMYRLGQSGNAAGFRDISYACGCSEGSVYNWTSDVVDGLNELSDSVVIWATEEECATAKQWVLDKSGVDKWSRGWAVVDSTHIDLAFRPAIHHQEYYNYQSNYSMNTQLVMLPHSLRIMECVVGFKESAYNQRVWAAGSLVLKMLCLYLDEGEFIWTDSAYGHSPFTVAMYSWEHALLKKDLR